MRIPRLLLPVALAAVPAAASGAAPPDGGAGPTFTLGLDAMAAATAVEQDTLPSPPAVFSRMASAGYLATYLELEAMAAAHPDAPPQWRGLLDELRGWTRAMLGDEQGALALEPGAPPRAALPEGFDDLLPVPAVPEIIEAARSRRLVIVNEAHHVARGRALTYELLQGLHDQGYRYLAVEAVSRRRADALAERGHPDLSTGTYTREPVFGDLLRRALEIGYTVVAYDTFPTGCRPTAEDPNRCTTLRDSLGAAAVHEQTFARDPEARVLMHVGYSHVVPEPRQGGARWLAYWMRERGVAPLTVEQTEMRERADPAHEPAEYRRAEALGWLTGPVVLRRPEGGWYRSPAGGFGSVEMQVFTPRARRVAGRPDWLFSLGRVPVPVPETALPCGGEPYLVQALVAGEAADAVPADQLLVGGDDAVALALRPGRYEVRVVGAEGEIDRTEVSVP